MKKWFLWYLALTLFVWPFRASFSQDDAVYFRFAQSLSEGNFHVHVLNVAGVWVQSFLAALAFHFSFLDAMTTANTLTWMAFGVLTFLVCLKNKNHISLILCFFTFPIWVQYGASFLPDMYTCLLVYLFFLHFRSKNFQTKFGFFLTFLLSFLIAAQYPSAIAFVVFWLLEKRDRSAYLSLVGVGAALLLKFQLPNSELQAIGLQLYSNRISDLHSYSQMFLKMLQLGVGIGLFLWPLIPISNFNRWIQIAFLHLLFSVLFFFGSEDVISAGVLFTNYFPKILSALFVAGGVWGWFGFFYDSKYKISDPTLLGTIIASLSIVAFDAFRTVQDLRYVLTLALIWFVIALRKSLPQHLLGNSYLTFAVMTVLSIFVNLYNLNTTESRWSVAHELESEGAHPYSISAGYGRDLFVYEPQCTEGALKKAQLDPQLLQTHILSKVPRVYEVEATPRYLIKPFQIFGKKINLNRNLREGQNSDPKNIVHYSVLGIPNAIAVYDAGSFQEPWCLRP